jgi:hypothetical protein
MPWRTRFGGLLGIGLATLALALGPTTARAEGPYPPPGDIFIISGDGTLTPPVSLSPSSGTYSFTTTGAADDFCLYYSDGDIPSNFLPELGFCNLTSSGTFTNQVCGTGTATSSNATTVTTTAVEGEGEGTVSSVAYTISFTAGVGTLTGTAFEGPDPGEAAGNNVTLTGTLTLTPTVGNCLSGVTGFHLAGTIVATDQ